MRQLREFTDERAAQLLTDALSDSGIDTELKESQDGRFSVWVLDETHLDRAGELSTRWLDQEPHEALEEAARRGRSAREISARIEQRKQRQIEAVARQIAAMSKPRPTPLTWGLIAICVAVAALTELGAKREMIASLTIADPRLPIMGHVVSVFGRQFLWLPLPWSEPWRLITPVLAHFGVIHIFFNMMWLRDLGRTIESVHGARYLAAFVVVSGAISNIAQYEIAQNPLFAGMSGVVYGLLGMIWMRGRLDSRVGYGLSRSTMQFMIVWLLLGFMGELFPRSDIHIANWCHLFGLLVGIAWAWLASRLSRAKR